MKINLAVLFGGNSVEHEISVISAIQAINYIDKTKYSIFAVYITKDNEMYHGDALLDISSFKDISGMLKKCNRVYFYTNAGRTYLAIVPQKSFKKQLSIPIDIAFPIVHGTNVEDGTMQGFLKLQNLPFVGCDTLSSAICMDKYYSKILLASEGFPVLEAISFTQKEFVNPQTIIEKTEQKFLYPVIVKPANSGSSIGISKASNSAGLRNSLDLAFRFCNRIIIEPAIVNMREINCSVLGDSDEAIASVCEEPVAQDEILSYSDKYINSGKSKNGGKLNGKTKTGSVSAKRVIPADLQNEISEKIREIAVEAFKFLDCSGVSRIDFIIDNDSGKIWLNELNTIPGSLAFYLWEPTGIQYTELLERLIDLAWRKQRKYEELLFSFETNILKEANFSIGAQKL